jgi:hypothetical protein
MSTEVDACTRPLLAPSEVVDPDRCQLRDLLAAQARDLAADTGVGQADIVRGQVGTTGVEEVPRPQRSRCGAVWRRYR